jgi:hypothetical protein
VPLGLNPLALLVGIARKLVETGPVHAEWHFERLPTFPPPLSRPLSRPAAMAAMRAALPGPRTSWFHGPVESTHLDSAPLNGAGTHCTFARMLGNDLALLCSWLDQACVINNAAGPLTPARASSCPILPSVNAEHAAGDGIDLDLRCDETLDETPFVQASALLSRSLRHRPRSRARAMPYASRRRVPCVDE